MITDSSNNSYSHSDNNSNKEKNKINRINVYPILKWVFIYIISSMFIKGCYDVFIAEKNFNTIVEVISKDYEYLGLRYEVNNDTIYFERTEINSLLSEVGQKFQGKVSSKDFSNIEIIYCMPYFDESDILDTTYAIVANINRYGFNYDVNDKWSFKVRSVFF